MADFRLNAQVNLLSPSASNLKSVANTIQKGLGKSANIKLKISGKGLKELNANLATLNKTVTSTQAKIQKLGSTYNKATSQSNNFTKAQQQVATGAKKAGQGVQGASSALQGFGRNITKTIKNAAAFSLVAGPIFGVQRALTNAAKEAALFQKELLKISQVTGQSVDNLGNLADTIDRLSTSLGVNAKELAETARVIAQTGRSGKELELILEGLAESTLASSFGDINNTTEGLIAILGQFNLKGSQTKEILGSINQVSKEFAVESGDLVQAVRRAGAVFNSAAGDTQNSITALQEFNAVFTSVRANTRESSETIAAGLRTIFSRLQRRDTIEFLKDFGVELIDQEGNFVGLFNAFEQLSEGLKKVDSAVTRSAIAEELGGIRQIGKLIPAIENFADAQAALEAGARGAAEGLGKDVDTALLSVAQRVEQTKAQFNSFIKDVFESDAFQKFAKNVLASTQTLITTFNALFDALEPILPLLSAIGTFKIAGSVLALGRTAAPVAAGAASAAASAAAGVAKGGTGSIADAKIVTLLSAIDANVALIASRFSGVSGQGSNTRRPIVGFAAGVTGVTGAVGAAGVSSSINKTIQSAGQALTGFANTVKSKAIPSLQNFTNNVKTQAKNFQANAQKIYNERATKPIKSFVQNVQNAGTTFKHY